MRFKSLDGWRGLAAIFVSLYHLEFLNHLYDSPFLRNSYLFVDFFFILSGFVITHAYLNKLKNPCDTLSFISKRIARLLPLHLFVLLMFVVFELLKLVLFISGSWTADTAPFTNEYSLSSLISNLFLMHSLGIHEQLTWNYPSWSISVEFYTYIIFAAVSVVAIRHRNMNFLLSIILISVSFYILYYNARDMNEATYNYGLFRCIPSFFLGSLSYKLFLQIKEKSIPLASLVEISLIMGIYFFIVYSGSNKFSLLAPFLFTLTVIIFSFEQGVISKILRVTFIQNLGKWSYSIYMLHALILLIIGRGFNFIEKVFDKSFVVNHASLSDVNNELLLINSPYFMDLLTLLYLVVLVYAASLTYKYIEVKGNKLFTDNKGLSTFSNHKEIFSK